MGALGQVLPWMGIPSHFQALSLCRIPFSSLTWAGWISSPELFPCLGTLRGCVSQPCSRGWAVPTSQQSFPGCWICLPARSQLPWPPGAPGLQTGVGTKEPLQGNSPGPPGAEDPPARLSRSSATKTEDFLGFGDTAAALIPILWLLPQRVRIGQVKGAVTGGVSNQQIPIFCTSL